MVYNFPADIYVLARLRDQLRTGLLPAIRVQQIAAPRKANGRGTWCPSQLTGAWDPLGKLTGIGIEIDGRLLSGQENQETYPKK